MLRSKVVKLCFGSVCPLVALKNFDMEQMPAQRRPSVNYDAGQMQINITLFDKVESPFFQLYIVQNVKAQPQRGSPSMEKIVKTTLDRMLLTTLLCTKEIIACRKGSGCRHKGDFPCPPHSQPMHGTDLSLISFPVRQVSLPGVPCVPSQDISFSKPARVARVIFRNNYAGYVMIRATKERVNACTHMPPIHMQPMVTSHLKLHSFLVRVFL